MVGEGYPLDLASAGRRAVGGPGQPAHFVHSKVWAWIALDRAVRTATALGMSRRRAAHWERERDLLADEIRRHGFSAERGCYVRAYGSDELDCALLLLPLTGFDMDGGRDRVAETIDSIWKELGAGGPLLYRYPLGHAGLPGGEGAFLPCSFWLLEGLLRLGRRDEGLRLFEEVLGIANELLLLPEEIDPRTGAYLGNYPLALSQAGLVHAVTEVQKCSTADSRAPGARSGSPSGLVSRPDLLRGQT